MSLLITLAYMILGGFCVLYVVEYWSPYFCSRRIEIRYLWQFALCMLAGLLLGGVAFVACLLTFGLVLWAKFTQRQ